jgi:fumarylacetoacetase
MTPVPDETHDPQAKSWIESANDPDSDFPIQNLPFGVFRQKAQNDQPSPRVGVAIGDQVLDLAALPQETWQDDKDAKVAASACASDSLSAFMVLGSIPRRALRRRLHTLLRKNATIADRDTVTKALVPQFEVEMLLPASIGDYTDFYASICHATNVGKLFRPDNPLLPNYKHIPIGYHGRASSLLISGTPVRRPHGQTRPSEAAPTFGPSKALDYEMEMGFFVSEGNPQGEPIPISQAEDHIFGICLLNDWSARDIQAWEYQPLGPFLGKSFATTLSPWVVTMEALVPFRVPAFSRAEGDPAPLPYLADANDQKHGGLDLWLEVSIQSTCMKDQGMAPFLLGRSNFRDMYWTMAQMLTHHASNGCNLRPGDLLASGTVSGEDKSARGCLLELTSRGRDPVSLPSGEARKFLEDGDEVILRGFCEREGFRRIGLGSCSGVITPAITA